MNRRSVGLSIALLLLLLCLAGCSKPLFAYDSEGNAILNSSVDYIQEKYSKDECRAEAECLFGTEFKVVSAKEPQSGEDRSVYTLRSEDIPFDINVFSYRYYGGEIGSERVLLAYAHCDYYEQMMNYKQAEASALAEKYRLKTKREGESVSVTVSSYDQLEAVYEYLNATNELYDFTVVEAQMTNILRDIRTRPTLDVYLDDQAFGITEGENVHVITLYYTINNDQHYYTKEALLPTIQETYIDVLDSSRLEDSTVTSDIREQRCKPALTQLCVNGEPLLPTDYGEFAVDPNVTFDYNWLLNNYYGNICICAPAKDYTLPANAMTGDDRSFKLLVELLGGSYYSCKDTDNTATSSYYTAEWWLGGNKYGAGSICQEYIPTMSSLSINGEGIGIKHYYSKEMCGLENGYGPEDYFIRITPEGLATLLGVTAEADYDNCILNLITPEGYFDHEPPPYGQPLQREMFEVKDISTNGIVKNANHYIIYRNDGSILEERTTKGDTYAECEQLSTNVVLLSTHGAGMSDGVTFFDTETGFISDIYYFAVVLGDRYVVYSPYYTSHLILENAMTGERIQLADDADESSAVVVSAAFSNEMSQITVTYKVPDEINYLREVTKTFDVTLS